MTFFIYQFKSHIYGMMLTIFVNITVNAQFLQEKENQKNKLLEYKKKNIALSFYGSYINQNKRTWLNNLKINLSTVTA